MFRGVGVYTAELGSEPQKLGTAERLLGLLAAATATLATRGAVVSVATAGELLRRAIGLCGLASGTLCLALVALPHEGELHPPLRDRGDTY